MYYELALISVLIAAGYWGFYGPGSQNGPPQGPPLHKQWMWDPDMPADLLALRPQIKSLPF